MLKDARIIFVHPDLGIGGAERLIIDAAVGLQNRGFAVTILTSYRDKTHCFDEARDGTLDVRVRGAWIVPRSILGRFTILCAILRQLHLLLATSWSGELTELRPAAFIIDQLSAGLPLLRWLRPASPVLFYCHFPDLLLAHGRIPVPLTSNYKEAPIRQAQKLESNLSPLKRLYRAPFDNLEAWSMGFATTIAVNSGFTKSIVETVWPMLGTKVNLKIIYPCVAPDNDTKGDSVTATVDVQNMWKGEKIILSINRFERKKDVGLAIRAFAMIPSEHRAAARLIIAGQYMFHYSL